MAEFNISIGADEYKHFQELENKTAKECYDKFGYKQYESFGEYFVINDQYDLHVYANIPSEETETVYFTATLHDKLINRYYDIMDVSDSIIGEYYFTGSDDTEVTVIVGVH